MTFPLIHILLIVAMGNYQVNRDSNKYGNTNSWNNIYDLTCICTSVAPNICMNYNCTFQETKPSCFAGSSEILLVDGTSKTLSEINIGDMVLVDQNHTYEPILSFIHAKADGLYGFLEMKIDSTISNSSTTLFVSSNHLIFDYDSNDAKFAGEFQVGDRVQLIEHGQIRSGEIAHIQLAQQAGYYAPLTSSGKIVVNGVLASNYATVNSHYLAHKVMSIYRLWIHFVGGTNSVEEVPWMLQIMLDFEDVIRWIIDNLYFCSII